MVDIYDPRSCFYNYLFKSTEYYNFIIDLQLLFPEVICGSKNICNQWLLFTGKYFVF